MPDTHIYSDISILYFYLPYIFADKMMYILLPSIFVFFFKTDVILKLFPLCTTESIRWTQRLTVSVQLCIIVYNNATRESGQRLDVMTSRAMVTYMAGIRILFNEISSRNIYIISSAFCSGICILNIRYVVHWSAMTERIEDTTYH